MIVETIIYRDALKTRPRLHIGRRCWFEPARDATREVAAWLGQRYGIALVSKPGRGTTLVLGRGR